MLPEGCSRHAPRLRARPVTVDESLSDPVVCVPRRSGEERHPMVTQ